MAYIPHVKLRSYPFPFLAANVDELDDDLLGFIDQEKSVDEHNMIFDVSICRHLPSQNFS
jgi:hypothetical protein